jgi:hypothetical protein
VTQEHVGILHFSRAPSSGISLSIGRRKNSEQLYKSNSKSIFFSWIRVHYSMGLQEAKLEPLQSVTWKTPIFEFIHDCHLSLHLVSCPCLSLFLDSHSV